MSTFWEFAYLSSSAEFVKKAYTVLLCVHPMTQSDKAPSSLVTPLHFHTLQFTFSNMVAGSELPDLVILFICCDFCI